MLGRVSPPNYSPLVATSIVALDLETTGLDVKKDRIVQIGAVAMLGTRILESPRIDRLVNPKIPIPFASTRIHGLRDTDVADADVFSDCIGQLQSIISNRVVVGHHVAFDLAILRHEAARVNIEWQDPTSLDLALMVGALEPILSDVGLENITAWLGIDIIDRHTALGDSLTAAQAFARLMPRLLEADVRTVGDALTFSARGPDLLARGELAGWNA